MFAGDMPSQTLSDTVRRGDLRPLARGIYTTATTGSPEAVVARHWPTIVGHEFPDAVITDRSALTGGKVDGYLYLSRDGRPRELALPGLDVLAFWEAYFSNYIEGTTFTVDEAKSIVFEGVLVANRTADSHDILGTYAIVADPGEMGRTAANPYEFVELLQARHATLMGGRPEIAGVFKPLPNQTGTTLFVDPALVDGTLREGWRRLAELDTAWERAVYTMFLVSEVHPFIDGNGRIARVMMNAELFAGRQSKIVVPTGFRSDYLSALRRLSRDDDPSVYIKAMRFLHDYTAQIDWTTHDAAQADLRTTNAFAESDDAARLRLLRPAVPT